MSVPTAIKKTVNVLPLSDDNTQLIRCKLKRKQSYTGLCHCEFVSTKAVYTALECLKQKNPFYKDTSLNLTWHNDIPPDLEEIGIEGHPDILEEQDHTTAQNEEDVKDRGYPNGTCL